MNAFLKTLLLLALLISMVVIPLGAFTRLVDAGLGCPDWPGCYGFIDFRDAMEHVNKVNEENPGALREAHKTWPEIVHRYFASTLGGLIMLMAIASFFFEKKNKDEVLIWGRLPWLLFVLVCFQGALGMWTVTMSLYPPVVLAHLYGGFIIFSLLSVLFLRVYEFTPVNHDPVLARYRHFLAICLAAIVIQIGLGGWMSSNYAALVCKEFPFCEAGWMSRIDIVEAISAPYHHTIDYEFGLMEHGGRVAVHVAHRAFAIIASALLIVFMLLAFKASGSSHTRKSLLVVALLLIVQIALGISNVVFSLPLAVATAHNGVGALLMAALCFLSYLAYSAAKASKSGAE